ncbi:MFS transporter [Streptomyces sp. NPDC058457]|uniref:MFS transporter n=1 Tax=Streptomyces sp. NPDC058457 TaxID=3346507 RepID=UPI003660A5E2
MWTVGGDTLVLAALLVTAARLGDMRGRRTLFAAGVAVFTAASAVWAPSPLVSLLVSPFAGRLGDRIGGRRVLLAGLLSFCAGLLTVILLAQGSASAPVFTVPLMFMGLGTGCMIAPLSTEAMGHVPAPPATLLALAGTALFTARAGTPVAVAA